MTLIALNAVCKFEETGYFCNLQKLFMNSNIVFHLSKFNVQPITNEEALGATRTFQKCILIRLKMLAFIFLISKLVEQSFL